MSDTDSDQCLFALDDDAHTRFLTSLEVQPAPSEAGRARFRHMTQWEASERLRPVDLSRML